MSSKKPTLIAAIGILAVAVVAIFLVLRGHDYTEHEAIPIGVIQPLTGELANFGKTVVNGITLACEDHTNASNEPPVDLIIEDDQAKPATAVAALRKLIDVNKVDVVIGALTSSATLAMAPISQERQVLLISPTASNPKLSTAGPFFFRVWPSDSFDGVIAARYCHSTLSARNACIIHVSNDYGLGLSDVFQATFQRLGGQISLVDSYPEETTDFRTLLTKIEGQKPDVIYIPGHPRGIATLLKQARELGMMAIFFANVAAEDTEFLQLASNAATGLYFTAPAFDIANAEGTAKDFVDRYRSRFSAEPDVHAVKGYEACSVILSALSMGHRSSRAIAEYLHSTPTFPGIAGAFSFDANGDVVTALAVKQYQSDGSVRTLTRVNPGSSADRSVSQ